MPKAALHTRATKAKRGLKILIVTNVKIMVLQNYDKNNKKENIFSYFFIHVVVFLIPDLGHFSTTHGVNSSFLGSNNTESTTIKNSA